MTSSCATLGLGSAQSAKETAPSAPPPRVEVAEEARKPCLLVTSTYTSLEDLETVNRLRGLSLIECDSRRALAVSGHDREHLLEDQHAKARADRRRAGWKKLTPWREP